MNKHCVICERIMDELNIPNSEFQVLRDDEAYRIVVNRELGPLAPLTPTCLEEAYAMIVSGCMNPDPIPYTICFPPKDFQISGINVCCIHFGDLIPSKYTIVSYPAFENMDIPTICCEIKTEVQALTNLYPLWRLKRFEVGKLSADTIGIIVKIPLSRSNELILWQSSFRTSTSKDGTIKFNITSTKINKWLNCSEITMNIIQHTMQMHVQPGNALYECACVTLDA